MPDLEWGFGRSMLELVLLVLVEGTAALVGLGMLRWLRRRRIAALYLPQWLNELYVSPTASLVGWVYWILWGRSGLVLVVLVGSSIHALWSSVRLLPLWYQSIASARRLNRPEELPPSRPVMILMGYALPQAARKLIQRSLILLWHSRLRHERLEEIEDLYPLESARLRGAFLAILRLQFAGVRLRSSVAVVEAGQLVSLGRLTRVSRSLGHFDASYV